MPKNVVITPLSGLVDFYDLNSNLDAKIQVDDAGSLNITNTGGTLTLGNIAANVYIGDGTNSVDVIFEQNGAIRALTGKTLTLGNSASNITVQSPLTINSPIVNTTTTGFFEVRQTVSTWTNSTSHPIIKWDFNATYDDNLYLASGGNAAGINQTALVITENAGVVIGIPNANPNSTSLLSAEWFRFDTSKFTITRNTEQYITFENSGAPGALIYSYSATSNAKPITFDSRTDVVGTAPTAGTLGYDFRVNGGNALTINTDRTISTNTGLTVGGALAVTGNLTVNGTTTTVNSTTVTIDDPIFTLGGDTAPTVDDNKDRGIEFRWHNGTVAKVGFFGYDDSTGYLTFIPDATNTSEVFSGTQGDIQATNFRGALVGNASTATTLATARNINGVSFNGSADITITANTPNTLTLGVSGTGLSGSTTFNGSAANTFTVTSNATSANTASAIVARDASGNFVAGRITASSGIIAGDTQGYPDYDFLLDFGADVANSWRKLVTVSSPTGQYVTIGFRIDITDPKANHATTATQDNVVNETYYIACVRTNDTVQDTPDACYVRGPGSRIRAVKTSTGNYEIQIQNEALSREYRGSIRVYAVNSAHTVTYHNGATALTGTAQYAASVSTTQTDIFQNIAARQATLSVPTGTAPMVVTSTTAVTNLNADLLDGNHSSAFYLATNPSGYTTNAGTVTSVGGTGTVSGLTLTGTVTTTGNLTLGGTLSVAASNFASQTANTVLIAPNGAAGVPTFRALVAADIPTLNQSTTGNAGTATTWQTARTLTIGSTGKSVDGSAAVTWSLAEIGAAPTTTPTLTGLREVQVAVAASNIDLSLANYFTRTISGATTFTVSNTPASGTAASFILDLTNGGSNTITWWANVKWAGGIAPALTVAGRDVLGFFTHDAGTTWSGLLLAKDIK